MKEGKTQRKSSTRKQTAPVGHSQAAKCDDDMSDPLEKTLKHMPRKGSITRLRGALPLASYDHNQQEALVALVRQKLQ
ncbi:hypothetical protein TURU_082043 [Turdus rufiventris]|nr:hypothetical protein TURU_082043 [Turdus rufiventris]